MKQSPMIDLQKASINIDCIGVAIHRTDRDIKMILVYIQKAWIYRKKVPGINS